MNSHPLLSLQSELVTLLDGVNLSAFETGEANGNFANI